MRKFLAVSAVVMGAFAALGAPAHAAVTVEGGTGVGGDGTPEDPTAGYDSEKFGTVKVGFADGPNAYGVFVQFSRESNGNLLAGRIGAEYNTAAGVLAIYAEDYTHKNPKADLVEDLNDATGCALLGTDADGNCGTVGEDDTQNDAILITIKP